MASLKILGAIGWTVPCNGYAACKLNIHSPSDSKSGKRKLPSRKARSPSCVGVDRTADLMSDLALRHPGRYPSQLYPTPSTEISKTFRHSPTKIPFDARSSIVKDPAQLSVRRTIADALSRTDHHGPAHVVPQPDLLRSRTCTTFSTGSLIRPHIVRISPLTSTLSYISRRCKTFWSVRHRTGSSGRI